MRLEPIVLVCYEDGACHAVGNFQNAIEARLFRSRLMERAGAGTADSGRPVAAAAVLEVPDAQDWIRLFGAPDRMQP